MIGIADGALDGASELDGRGAIVSHVEVLFEYANGVTRPADIAQALGVSASTARRLLRNLSAAGLLEASVLCVSSHHQIPPVATNGTDRCDGCWSDAQAEHESQQW